MIRNVVIHMVGEQPMLADLRSIPTAEDAGLVCTNLRTMNGKAPTFIDRSDAWFLFPLVHVRFVEIPASQVEELDASPGEGAEPPEREPDLELDEDFLRRIREA
ncbi:MAG: hypothetical protein H0V12_01135 [Chloroflexi bacterium]|nr:hypothetical protein [Chloroflexota bacterium]